MTSTVTQATRDALTALRERTQALHLQLELAVDISSALGSIAAYTRLLRGYWNIFISFEDALQANRSLMQGSLLPPYWSRVSLLDRDLNSLGENPRIYLQDLPAIVLPRLTDMDSLLGALYVVEGSSLGGQMIYREIQQKLKLDATCGAAFFFGSGEQTGPAWKRFTALLNQRIEDPERAAKAASEMFLAFEDGLRAATREDTSHE